MEVREGLSTVRRRFGEERNGHPVVNDCRNTMQGTEVIRPLSSIKEDFGVRCHDLIFGRMR